MPDPISTSNQSLNFTPYEPEGAEGNVCAPPDDEAESTFTNTQGDGKIHREGLGFRVDPSGTTTGQVTVGGQKVDVTMTGVDAIVALTDRNADGSTGVRAAASANIWQGTATMRDGDGNEITGGLGVGVGGDASIGRRDADGDGVREVCVRGSYLFFVGGVCTEAVGRLIDGARKALNR